MDTGELDRTGPPDPATAGSLDELLAMLMRLHFQAGSPGYKRKLQQMADRALGPGELSGSTVHRVFTGVGESRLARVQEPERFVRNLVTALGADPKPWVAAVQRLLAPPAPPDAEPRAQPALTSPGPAARWRRFLLSRAGLAVSVVLVLAAAAVISWSAAPDEATPPQLDTSRPVFVQSGSTDLRLAIDRGSDQHGDPAVVVEGTRPDVGVWTVDAPYRDNSDYWQLRPSGRLLMCLEVHGKSIDEGTPVQQWGCTGEQHQYWRFRPSDGGKFRVENLGSGQCLAVAGAEPQAGMRLVQRTCDDRQPGQLWLTPLAAASAQSSAPPSQVQGAVGPDLAEFPGGGKDQPCDGIFPALAPDATRVVRQGRRDP